MLFSSKNKSLCVPYIPSALLSWYLLQQTFLAIKAGDWTGALWAEVVLDFLLSVILLTSKKNKKLKSGH